MTRSWLTACLALVLFLTGVVLAPQALADDKSEDVAFGRWWQRPIVAKKLNLDEAMTQRLDALYVERKSRLIDLKAEMKKERLRLQVLLDDPDLTRERAMAEYDKVHEVRGRLGRERMTYFLDVREVIGQERFSKLIAWYKQRRDVLRNAYKEKKRALDQEEGGASE